MKEFIQFYDIILYGTITFGTQFIIFSYFRHFGFGYHIIIKWLMVVHYYCFVSESHPIRSDSIIIDYVMSCSV